MADCDAASCRPTARATVRSTQQSRIPDSCCSGNAAAVLGSIDAAGAVVAVVGVAVVADVVLVVVMWAAALNGTRSGPCKSSTGAAARRNSPRCTGARSRRQRCSCTVATAAAAADDDDSTRSIHLSQLRLLLSSCNDGSDAGD